jgi:amidase
MSDDLVMLGALAARRLLASGEVTSAELVDAAARRIAIVEPAVNALPTLCLERARAQAQSADRARRAGQKTRLGGLPIVVKDNNDVGGVRTTGGTPIFKSRIAEVSDRTIAKLESNGAIVLGKSNLSAAACGFQRRSAMSPDCARRRAGCRASASPIRSIPWPSKVRWPVMSATSP